MKSIIINKQKKCKKCICDWQYIKKNSNEVHSLNRLYMKKLYFVLLCVLLLSMCVDYFVESKDIFFLKNSFFWCYKLDEAKSGASEEELMPYTYLPVYVNNPGLVVSEDIFIFK